MIVWRPRLTISIHDILIVVISYLVCVASFLAVAATENGLLRLFPLFGIVRVLKHPVVPVDREGRILILSVKLILIIFFLVTLFVVLVYHLVSYKASSFFSTGFFFFGSKKDALT